MEIYRRTFSRSLDAAAAPRWCTGWHRDDLVLGRAWITISLSGQSPRVSVKATASLHDQRPYRRCGQLYSWKPRCVRSYRLESQSPWLWSRPAPGPRQPLARQLPSGFPATGSTHARADAEFQEPARYDEALREDTIRTRVHDSELSRRRTVNLAPRLARLNMTSSFRGLCSYFVQDATDTLRCRS